MSTYAAYYILKLLISVTLQRITFNRKKTRPLKVTVFLIWQAEWVFFIIFCLKLCIDLFQLQP